MIKEYSRFWIKVKKKKELFHYFPYIAKGRISEYYEKLVSTDDTITDVNEIARQKRYEKKGDFLINLAAMPITDKGMVNTLRVSEIE